MLYLFYELKERLRYRCFSLNFAKFLTTRFLMEHLRCVLLIFGSYSKLQHYFLLHVISLIGFSISTCLTSFRLSILHFPQRNTKLLESLKDGSKYFQRFSSRVLLSKGKHLKSIPKMLNTFLSAYPETYSEACQISKMERFESR